MLPRLKDVILLIAAAAMLVLAGYFLWQYLELRRENKELLRNKEQLTRRYDETNEKLLESQRILERLRTDPEFVEMIIRRRLGYAKPDELIYNFDPPPATDPLLFPPAPDSLLLPPPTEPPPRQQPRQQP
jgi:cell division protein FtsB